jgi:holo-[acyl-carrier protein] synthase
MSVLGVGIDLVDVESFGRQLALPGTTFAVGTFTPSELAAADEAARSAPCYSTARARHLAARFAAKEAFIKAWSSARAGQPPAMGEVDWHGLEVRKDAWNRPFMVPIGATADRVRESLGEFAVSISLSHEDSMAAAMVVISEPNDRAGGKTDGDAAATEPVTSTNGSAS